MAASAGLSVPASQVGKQVQGSNFSRALGGQSYGSNTPGNHTSESGFLAVVFLAAPLVNPFSHMIFQFDILCFLSFYLPFDVLGRLHAEKPITEQTEFLKRIDFSGWGV